MTQLSHIIHLSFRDYNHEWRMSGCFVFALASVLAPMMILFGLKFGIVSTMVNGLIENPANREIKPVGSGQYSEQWIKDLRHRHDVAFIIPRTRALAATIQLKGQMANKIVSAELMATAMGDPLLADIAQLPVNSNEIILNRAAADRLNVDSTTEIDGSLIRQYQGKRERVHFPLQVINIASAPISRRYVAFVDLDLLIAIEQFKDGRAVADFGWAGDTEIDEVRTFPSFRLYARSIYDVQNIVTDLEKQGIRVKANIREIETIRSVDQNLSVVFWIIACVAAVGFALSLGASLWANVDRKSKDLSVLRLIGFRSIVIILFPVLQSCYTALFGWLLAVLIYLGFEQIINRLLAPRVNLAGNLCYLLTEHFFWALMLTVATAIIAAMLGGLRVAKIEPADGLRDV